MIKKHYDFRQTAIPAALLQAEVTADELAAEKQGLAARFTEIAAVDGPAQNGDVVALSFADETAPGGVRTLFANVGKDFTDEEALVLGRCVGDNVCTRYAGREVTAQIVGIKRPLVPGLTEAHVGQLGIAGVESLAQLEDSLFAKLAEGQRKRKFRGIMGIVSKALMENTEFAPMGDDHPWLVALEGSLMGRIRAFADREGLTLEQAMPVGLGMAGKSVAECRAAVKNMCIERARQGALGLAIAKENGVELAHADANALIEQAVNYLNQAIYEHFAPQIQVKRP